MTIRDYIKRRMWWCAAVGFGGWLVFAFSAATSGGKSNLLYIAVGMACFGEALLALQWFVRCPNCNSRLARTIGMNLAFHWVAGARVNFCPFCAVSLDRPVAHSRVSADFQNPVI